MARLSRKETSRLIDPQHVPLHYPKTWCIVTGEKSATSLSVRTSALGTAQAVGSGLYSFVRESIDPVVLTSTTSASLKLLIICMAVRWLSESGRIPVNTSVVLAQVGTASVCLGYFSRKQSYKHRVFIVQVSFQLLIPCMLFVKVVSILAMQSDPGLLLGMAVAAVTQIGVGAFWGRLLSPLVDEDSMSSFKIAGWAPFAKKKASTTVAEATSKAMGVPHATAALLPKPEKASAGYKSLIAAACAFQNSFTLPAVFLLSLLPGPIADRAVAYLGLYLLAWSPCLWSFGLYSIQRGYQRDQGMGQKFSWSQMLKGTMNPPVIAVVLAVCLGLTPIGQSIFSTGSMSTAGFVLPFELSIVSFGLQNVYEVIEMLGGGTLAIQTLVLAASLLQPADGAKPKRAPGILGEIKSFFKSESLAETRALCVLGIVRFILAPMTAILLFRMLSQMTMFSTVLSDPIFLFVVAVQSVMPSAQNLLIALQLNQVTQGAAPELARLLLKLYALAILPVTVWVTGFASRLAIPLV